MPHFRPLDSKDDAFRHFQEAAKLTEDGRADYAAFEVERYSERGLAMLKQAAGKGHIPAQFELAQQDLQSVNKETQQWALGRLLVLADQHGPAARLLGTMYDYGEAPVKADKKKAFESYVKARSLDESSESDWRIGQLISNL